MLYDINDDINEDSNGYLQKLTRKTDKIIKNLSVLPLINITFLSSLKYNLKYNLLTFITYLILLIQSYTLLSDDLEFQIHL